MKRFLLLFALAVLGVAGANAQDGQLSKEEERDLRKKSIQQQREELMETRHQVRLGVGGYITMNSGVYYNTKAFAPTNVEYTYRVVEFLEVGGFFGAYFSNSDVKEYEVQDAYAYKLHQKFFNAGVFARYSWFNRKWVSLYSTLGVCGIYYCDTKSDIYEGYTPEQSDPEFYVRPEFTPIGIRVGRRFFGYFEPFAISTRGVILMFGLGYKF